MKNENWNDGFPEPAQFAGAGGWGGRRAVGIGVHGPGAQRASTPPQAPPAGGSGARAASGIPSTSAGSSSRGMRRARSSRISRTRAGETWTCLTTGASRGPSTRMRRRRGKVGIYPRVSAGTGNTSAFPNLTETERYSSSSRAFISSARYGSTVSTSANGRTGYIGFSYDLTPHLKYGGDNVIAVKADNSHQPNCRWYSGSGIYRHTWLLVTNQVHVA